MKLLKRVLWILIFPGWVLYRCGLFAFAWIDSFFKKGRQ
jgi:hypothetical protein